MTREELEMRVLVRESDVIDRTDGSELAKAFNHLWEKYVEQESCDDTIRRQAVLDYIYNDLGLGDEENGKDVERQMELESSYRYIKSLPSVKPQELKTAQWIVNEWGNIYCSGCGCAALYDKVYPGESVFGKAIRVKTTFCPTCGAKMVEPQESEVRNDDRRN